MFNKTLFSTTLNETVLWTNPSPTSATMGFNATLSDNLTNYKYIKIFRVYYCTAFNWEKVCTNVENIIYNLRR